MTGGSRRARRLEPIYVVAVEQVTALDLDDTVLYEIVARPAITLEHTHDASPVRPPDEHRMPRPSFEYRLCQSAVIHHFGEYPCHNLPGKTGQVDQGDEGRISPH